MPDAHIETAGFQHGNSGIPLQPPPNTIKALFLSRPISEAPNPMICTVEARPT